MAIKSGLAVILAEREMKLSELEEKTGISLNNLSILKTGKAKAVRFSTLNEISKPLPCFFQVFAVSGWAQSDDRLYFSLECSQARQCIDLAYGNGKTESVQATPAQVLAKEDIKPASLQKHGRISPMLNLELNEEASRKLAAITGENIGRRLLVVFGNRILIAAFVFLVWYRMKRTSAPL